MYSLEPSNIVHELYKDDNLISNIIDVVSTLDFNTLSINFSKMFEIFLLGWIAYIDES